MIVMRIKGGLGNQLFQYAAGYAIAQRLQQPLALQIGYFGTQTLRGFKLNQLHLPEETRIIDHETDYWAKIWQNSYINKMMRCIHVEMLPVINGKYLLETRSEVMDKFFQIDAENIYLDGYFQSPRYFELYRQDLCNYFYPVYESDIEYKMLVSEINECNSIAVHVRRGDFLKMSRNPRRYLLKADYYHRALLKMNEQVKKTKYYWFSDDLEWVKREFGEQGNFRFVTMRTQHSDIDELMLMSRCKHIIAANSTFSWWASWLNQNADAIHIVPARRYGNVEMIPDGWIKL